MTHLDLFSGIGGFSIASQNVWGGIEHIFCDNNMFSQAILKKYWPQSKIYGDIKELKGSEIGTVDLVTGGFPCQPFSAAGKRKGTKDDRHLWPEMLRVIRETSPRWIIGENVGGLLTWNGGMVLDQVYTDLEAEGYEVWSFVIPACAVNAPHRRDRVWIVAYANCGEGTFKAKRLRQWNSMGKLSKSDSIRIFKNSGCEYGKRKPNERKSTRSDQKRNATQFKRPATSNGSGIITNTTSKGLERIGNKGTRQSRFGSGERRYKGGDWRKDWPEVATRLCTLDDGLPNGLPRPRGWRNAALKATGNSIVPQIAEKIMRAIKDLSPTPPLIS